MTALETLINDDTYMHLYCTAQGKCLYLQHMASHITAYRHHLPQKSVCHYRPLIS